MMNRTQLSLTTLLMTMILTMMIGMIQFQTSLLDIMNNYLAVLGNTGIDISSMVLIQITMILKIEFFQKNQCRIISMNMIHIIHIKVILWIHR